MSWFCYGLLINFLIFLTIFLMLYFYIIGLSDLINLLQIWHTVTFVVLFYCWNSCTPQLCGYFDPGIPVPDSDLVSGQRPSLRPTWIWGDVWVQGGKPQIPQNLCWQSPFVAWHQLMLLIADDFKLRKKQRWEHTFT